MRILDTNLWIVLGLLVALSALALGPVVAERETQKIGWPQICAARFCAPNLYIRR